jgi:hypothetical protein
MGIVIRKPTPIAVLVGLKHTISKDRKEVAALAVPGCLQDHTVLGAIK